jgi:hypothetical protein
MGDARFRALVGAREYRRTPQPAPVPDDDAAVAAAPGALAARGGRGSRRKTLGGARAGAAAAAAPRAPAKWKNVNALLASEATVPGCVVVGVKTGITPGAQGCLALMAAPADAFAALTEEDVTPDAPLFLSIVLGSRSRTQRFIDSQRLMGWGSGVVEDIRGTPLL